MPTDHRGTVIRRGDTVAFSVGIPSREVRATVREKVDHRGSRLIVRDTSGEEMDLTFVLDFFYCRVVDEKIGTDDVPSEVR